MFERIADITSPHLKALKEDITKEYPEQPDMAVALAVGFAVSVLLKALSTPEEVTTAVEGINAMAQFCGYALRPTM